MRSMTGYGLGTASDDLYQLTVEIRSVNNRYLDLLFRLPRELASYEVPLREKAKQRVVRGKLNINISLGYVRSDEDAEHLNLPAIKRRYQALQEVKTALGLPDEVGLEHLLQFSELFSEDLSDVDLPRVEPLLFAAADQALQALNKMREKEGAYLQEDMRRRLQTVGRLNQQIQKKGRSNIKKEFDKLLKNVLDLVDEQKIDRARLEQEVAIIADRVDITEECVRLASHLEMFEKALEQEEEAGKKLNFVLQEMHREANTMNSKTSDLEIAQWVIQMKEEVEKLREQVQNIE